MTPHFHLLNTCGKPQGCVKIPEESHASTRRLWSPSAILIDVATPVSKAHPILYLVNRVRKCQKKTFNILTRRQEYEVL